MDVRARRRHCLRAMGVERWVPRGAPDVAADPEPVPAAAAGVAVPAPAAGAAAELSALAETVSRCERCELHRTRNRTVFGVGAAHAECMVIGEGPGRDEDRLGEPFVGRAGKLLDAMMRAIGLDRDAVYIANIVKCRCPDNRDPRPEEVAACADYLRRQIELVAPRVIVAVGRVAAQNILGTAHPIGRLRGRRHAYPGTDVPVVVTYHPAYLLRSPVEKRKAWEDLKVVRRLLAA